MKIISIQTLKFNHQNEKGQLIVKGEISGETEIPLFDDLKFEAIIALLHAIDKRNFTVSEKDHLFDKYMTEIEETVREMKKYNHFQGTIKTD